MSASHNPGGPKEDWGIKFNYTSGEPAPEKITDEIYGFTQTVDTLKMADIPDVDLSQCGVTKFGDFEVEVIDQCGLPRARRAGVRLRLDQDDLLKRVSFPIEFDAMHAITARVRQAILVDALGADPRRAWTQHPKDFAGSHRQPHVRRGAREGRCSWARPTSARQQRRTAAAITNMILENNFFVTSDSVHQPPRTRQGASRTSRTASRPRALHAHRGGDRVAEKLGVECFETPTGWKYLAASWTPAA